MLAADAGELLGTRSERAIGQHRVAELIGPFKVVVVFALSSASSADESRGFPPTTAEAVRQWTASHANCIRAVCSNG